MKKNAKKRTFLIEEIQNGEVVSSTRVLAANSKSLWRTSAMKKILLNRSFESFLNVRELSIEVK